MFKNIRHHIIQIVFFSVIAVLAYYILVKNLFDLPAVIKQNLMYCLLIIGFSILYIEFNRQTRTVVKYPVLVICTFIAITFICNKTVFIYNIFGNNIEYHRVAFYVSYAYLFAMIVLYILTARLTILGLLLVLDTLVTIFIYFPYGYPSFDLSVFDYRAGLPIYNLADYRIPFIRFDSFWDVFLNFRRLFTGILIISILFISFKRFRELQIRQRVIQNKMQKTSFSKDAVLNFIPYVSNILLSIGNSILFFFSAVGSTIFEQIKKSLQLFLFIFVIYVIFSLPVAIDYFSNSLLTVLLFITIHDQLNFTYLNTILSFGAFALILYLTALFLNTTTGTAADHDDKEIKKFKSESFVLQYDHTDHGGYKVNKYILIPRLQKAKYDSLLFLFYKIILVICISSFSIFLISWSLSLFTILFFVIISLGLIKLVVNKNKIEVIE